MVQRRSQTSQLFDGKSPAEYHHSFGTHDGDFWLGNIIVHDMAERHPYVLRFEFTSLDGKTYVEYGGFSLYVKDSQYRIRLGAHLDGNETGGYLFVGDDSTRGRYL